MLFNRQIIFSQKLFIPCRSVEIGILANLDTIIEVIPTARFGKVSGWKRWDRVLRLCVQEEFEEH